jgi:p-hydroxybenzoate 3-monooxygenase
VQHLRRVGLLVGDTAHIAPPTGAKGLNLAAADMRVLVGGLAECYRSRRTTLLDEYSAQAPKPVWKVTRFSWRFTILMHRISNESFAHRTQLAELEYLVEAGAASPAFAKNYMGLKFQ